MSGTDRVPSTADRVPSGTDRAVPGAAEQPGAPRRRGWLTRRPLRTRLAILTAVAVSVAVALCAGASWFFAQQQMLRQVDRQLTSAYETRGGLGGGLDEVYRACNHPGFPERTVTQTVMAADGSVCPANDPRAIVVTREEQDALADNTLRPHCRDGETKGGTAVRVCVTTLTVPGQQGGQPLTLIFANGTPLDGVDRALGMLALILLVVSIVVILGSVLAALLVARTALKPVDRLTEAVEYIARTEDLGTTIPVEGEDEIARLSTSFNSMSTALASSRERQSQLIADAGHELRTPLTSLRTNVDLLVRSEETGRALPEETRGKLLRNLKAQMIELSTLIGDLLELSRPTRPTGSAPPQVVPWHDLVVRALERARLRGPGITFNVELNPWFVRADVHALERAVINLLDNAVKFSPPDGAVDVRLRNGRLTVRDRGPGIPADEIPHVFERFWRSPSARQLPGSGLGLAIVAQTVREAGGEVAMSAADPRPDGSTGGALAAVTLPGAPTPPPG